MNFSTDYDDDDMSVFDNKSGLDASSSASCVDFDDSDLNMITFHTFWVEGVVLCVLAVTGLCANALSIHILNKDDLRTFFSHLLIALSVIDSFYLLLCFLEAFRRSFELTSHVHIYLFPYFLYPLHSTVMLSSIYMTIAIAVERYRAVVFPISLRQTIHTSKRLYHRRLFKYIFTVAVLAVLISIPRFFEMRVDFPTSTIEDDPDRSAMAAAVANLTAEAVEKRAAEDNSSLTEAILPDLGRPRIVPTELRTNPIYSTYYVNLTRFLLTGAGPIVLLSFFYYRIYHEVKGHNAESVQISSSLMDEQKRKQQEDVLAKLFIHIIMAFIVCQLPRVIINVQEMILISQARECYSMGKSAYGVWVHVGVCYSHVLLVANSSINIVFYVKHNKSFKRHFLDLMARFWCTRCCFHSQITALARERSLRRCQSLMATRGAASNAANNGHSLTVVVENNHVIDGDVVVDDDEAHARQTVVVVENAETVM